MEEDEENYNLWMMFYYWLLDFLPVVFGGGGFVFNWIECELIINKL